MIDFDYRPNTYFDGTGPSALLAKLRFPESQWGEELSIYAAPLDGEIYYEVVDFYGNDFKVNPKKSREPLTLQEFIFLIETMENAEKSMDGNIQLTLMGIPEAESLVYPQLSQYFEEKRKNFGIWSFPLAYKWLLEIIEGFGEWVAIVAKPVFVSFVKDTIR